MGSRLSVVRFGSGLTLNPEVALVLRHVIGRIRARWPAVEIIVRGDSHYSRPEAMA